jgi:cytochrome c-type biogenesis protein CcmH
MVKWLVIFTFVSMLFFTTPHIGMAENHELFVSREEMLNVAKELHAPGCTDSRTANYCQLSTSYDLRAEIWDLLETGMNKEQVIDKLVDKYGERILAAPNKQGFNLLAWILPGVAIAVGAVTVAYVLRLRVRRTSHLQNKHAMEETVSPEQEKQVQDELKNWL